MSTITALAIGALALLTGGGVFRVLIKLARKQRIKRLARIAYQRKRVLP